MKDRIIQKDQLRVDEKESARLSYDMVFEQDHEEMDSDARELLEQTRAEWEKKLVRERQKAIEEGYQAGYRDGYEQARQEVEQQLSPVKQALEQVESRLETFTEEIKPALTTLVFELAEKVLSVPVENEDLKQQVAATVKTWLDRFRNEQQVNVYVSETDFETVKQLVKDDQNAVVLNVSPEVNPGEFHIETNHQAVIQNFKKHLTHLRSKSEVKEALNLPDA